MSDVNRMGQVWQTGTRGEIWLVTSTEGVTEEKFKHNILILHSNVKSIIGDATWTYETTACVWEKVPGFTRLT